MSQEPCECLKEWDMLGIVFVYLVMLHNDPSGYALQLTISWSEWKRRKICPLSPVSAQGSHSAFRKVLRCWRNPEGQVCHFPGLPWVPAELLGWFLSPVSQLLCGMTGYLHGRPVLQVALLQLLQTFICPLQTVCWLFFTCCHFSLHYPFLSYLSRISSSHSISL